MPTVVRLSLGVFVDPLALLCYSRRMLSQIWLSWVYLKESVVFGRTAWIFACWSGVMGALAGTRHMDFRKAKGLRAGIRSSDRGILPISRWVSCVRPARAARSPSVRA